MATKATIISDINSKIITNGNIRAADTSRILKNILNCDELNAQNPQNALQDVMFADGPIDIGTAIISYSIRGFVGMFANITLDINIKENNSSNFNVPYNDSKITTFLDTIIKNNNRKSDFLVKIRNQNTKGIYNNLSAPQKVFRIGNLNFGYGSNKKEVLQISIESQEVNDKLFNGDSISCSFAIHVLSDDKNTNPFDPKIADPKIADGKKANPLIKTPKVAKR